MLELLLELPILNILEEKLLIMEVIVAICIKPVGIKQPALRVLYAVPYLIMRVSEGKMTLQLRYLNKTITVSNLNGN